MTRGGVRPVVTTSPDNEEHWVFPKVEIKEFVIMATVVKIGILVMMNMHIYSLMGKSTCKQTVARLGCQMNEAV